MGKGDSISIEIGPYTVTPRPGETILPQDGKALQELKYAQQDIVTATIKNTAKEIANHPKRGRIKK